MCFEFSSCFGGGRDDYGGERSNRNRNEAGRGGRRGNNNRIGYYAGADHTTAYHNQPPAAVDEAGHKAYHDGARKADSVCAGDRHGGYAAYAQHKADMQTPNLPGVPAWPNKVGDDAYKYTSRLQEPAAMDYHHYPTTTTTTTLGRY